MAGRFRLTASSVAVIYSSGLITRISLADQQRKDLTSGADVTGGIAWSKAGIVFGRGGALWIISPDGGAPRALTALDAARHEVAHDGPVVLPGERLVLFASQTTEPGAERIESVSIDGGPRSVVVERATTPVWSPTGHLLFSRDGAVLAMAFDARTGKPSGAAVPVVPSGEIEALASGQLAMSLSATGTLLFAPVGFADARVRLGEPRRRRPGPRAAAIESVFKPSDLTGWAPASGRGRWQRDRGGRSRAWHAGPAHGGGAERAVHHVECRRNTRRVPSVRRAVLGGRRRQQ